MDDVYTDDVINVNPSITQIKITVEKRKKERKKKKVTSDRERKKERKKRFLCRFFKDKL